MADIRFGCKRSVRFPRPIEDFAGLSLVAVVAGRFCIRERVRIRLTAAETLAEFAPLVGLECGFGVDVAYAVLSHLDYYYRGIE